MSETNDIEKKLRELLGKESERSPESLECARIESAVLHVSKMYSRTVAILLNLNDADPEAFSASYSGRNAGIIRAYENFEAGVKKLESMALESGVSRESLVALAELRDAMNGADVRSAEDFTNGKAEKALMLEFVIPSWKHREDGNVSPSETVGKFVAAILH